MEISREFCLRLCCGSILIVSLLIIIASIIIGSIGASSFVNEKHDESIYKLTQCFITNYTLIIYNCPTQSCHSTGSDEQCVTFYYACRIQTYTVIYNVSDGRELQTTITAEDGPGPKSVNQTHKCYYDSTDITSVRWTPPNPLKYLIMLCFGWSILIFYILLILGLIIWVKWRN